MFIEIKGLNKTYQVGDNKNHVLKDLDVSIKEGEICIIMGSSGSGKSTLLNCIGGLETIDTGSVIVDGKEIARLNQKKLSDYRRGSLGFVFQFYNLIPNLTVEENVELCRYLSKEPLDTDELLEMLGILEKKHAFPNTLSGGEQQRCAIARALAKNPKVLLCDEPTGAMDSKTAKNILCLLEEINKKLGTTILMVTHNPAIEPMAHRVLMLHDGRITKEYVNENRVMAKDLEDI